MVKSNHKYLANIVLWFSLLVTPFVVIFLVWNSQRSELNWVNEEISSLRYELDQSREIKSDLRKEFDELESEINKIPVTNTFLKMSILEEYNDLLDEFESIQTLSRDMDAEEFISFKKDIISLQNGRINSNNDLARNIVQSLGGIFFLATTFLTFRSVKISEDKQISERFNGALDSLKDSSSELVRIGGIYSLEQIAIDSPKIHWVIIEVLLAFIRERIPKKIFSSDIQAALTVIGRRNFSNDPDDKYINLCNGYFIGANLENCILKGVNLKDCTLQGANLRHANLEDAILLNVNLSRADMTDVILRNSSLIRKVNLIESTLDGANLHNANLTGCHLMGASLRGANLGKAKLNNADIRGAILYGALELTPDQIINAKNWEKAKYSSSFRKKLKLYCRKKEISSKGV